MAPSTSAPLLAAAAMYAGFPETLLTNVIGCQPIFVATTSAVIVGIGVETRTNVFAPAALSATTCCVKLVAVVSYDCVATIFDWSLIAALNAFRKSVPYA